MMNKKLHIFFIVIILCCISTQVCFAQFVVKDKASLTIHSKLTSKEPKNNIASKINGQGILTFVNQDQQFVYITEDISLSKIEFKGKSAATTQTHINTTLNIKGILSLSEVTLNLNSPVLVYGAFNEYHSIILNHNLLTVHLAKEQDKHKGLTQGITHLLNKQYISLTQTEDLTTLYLEFNKHTLSIKDNHYKSNYKFKMIKPPQKFV